MLSGIALSVAQAMGMHRDGAFFSLTPVETEVRRRIWWSLCQLDNRISDDCGLEAHVPLAMDTRLPLHINDLDLGASSTESLVSRNEFTEMTVSLIKIEMTKTSFEIKRQQHERLALRSEQTESIAQQQIRRYEDTYLKYLSISSHLHRLCYLGTRLIIAKLGKMTYDQHSDDGQQDVESRLLSYNTEVLEITHQLPNRSGQYGWFFGCKYIQWHATAHLLIELCKHTSGPVVDRSWTVVDGVFGDMDYHGDAAGPDGMQKQNAKSVLWQPLLRLLKRARLVRKQALQGHEGLSDGSFAFDSGCEVSSETLTEDDDPPLLHQDGLLGDPFLGSALDFGEEMSWEQFDTLLHDFQTDICYEQESIDYQGNNLTGALSLW